MSLMSKVVTGSVQTASASLYFVYPYLEVQLQNEMQSAVCVSSSPRSLCTGYRLLGVE